MELFAVGLALAALLPFVVTQLLIRSTPFHNNSPALLWIGLAINVAGNLLAQMLVIVIVFDTQHPIDRILLILREGAYQDYELLALSSAVCLALAVVIAMVVRVIFYRWQWNEVAKRDKGILLLLFALWLPVLIAGCSVGYRAGDNLVIDEVCRRTVVKQLGADGETAEEKICYVVLHNHGSLTCRMNRIYLSSDPDDLLAYAVSNVEIPPDGTYRITMTADSGLDLKKNGNSMVYVASSAGKPLDSVLTPPLADDECYRRVGEDWEIVRLATVEGNETPAVPVPEFSAQSGFYTQEFFLALSAADGQTIHYTLDSSTPTADSPVYQGGIHVYNRSAEPNMYASIQNVRKDFKNHPTSTRPVDKAFVVRAVCVDGSGNTSEVVTKTYFVGLEKYRGKAVVSLVADPDDLFDSERGIYVTGKAYDDWYEEYLTSGIETPEPEANFNQQGEEWERAANFELFENQSEVINQRVGIRIQGAASRGISRKRFSIYSRKDYSGSKWFDAPIFGDKLTHSVFLRKGISSTVGFLNAFSHALASDRDIAHLQSFDVCVFLNGEYWSNYYLSEKFSDEYFAQTFGVSEDNVRFAKFTGWTDVEPETRSLYDEARYFAQSHDLSVEENYRELDRMIDIQNYIEWWCITAYLDNEDTAEELNGALWRADIKENDGVGDGRWRYALYDMDLGWQHPLRTDNEDPVKANTFTMGTVAGVADHTLVHQPMYAALRKNPEFCRQFVLTFMDLVNTTFRPERALSMLDQWGRGNEPTYVDFFSNRANYITQYMAEEFELTGVQATVTLRTDDPAAGSIKLNTVTPDLSKHVWSGQYYTDVPVTVTAEANPGYVFDHWIINGKRVDDRTTEVSFGEGGADINAVFQTR